MMTRNAASEMVHGDYDLMADNLLRIADALRTVNEQLHFLYPSEGDALAVLERRVYADAERLRMQGNWRLQAKFRQAYLAGFID